MHSVTFFVVVSVCSGYQFQCPQTAQWSIRARHLCPDPSKYSCLENALSKGFTETCGFVDLERPSRRIVLRGGVGAGDCSTSLYQPRDIPYWTNVSTDCIYIRSNCTQIGQVIADDKDLYDDTTCRCDYTQGYDFVTKPKNPCFCVPSREDCSCYYRKCQTMGYILSPDYECIDKIKEIIEYSCCFLSKDRSYVNKTQAIYIRKLPKDISEREKWTLIPVYIIAVLVLVKITLCTCIYFDKMMDVISVDRTCQIEKAFDFTEHENRSQKNRKRQETECLLLFCNIVHNIAPRAIRHLCDREFPPDRLKDILESNRKKLIDLKRTKIISTLQWNCIFPKGFNPISSTFDVDLMICLFHNLANISPECGFYDTLPKQNDISLGAELARLKYYMNYAERLLETGKMLEMNEDYTPIFDTVIKAVGSVGGKEYQQECDILLESNIDPYCMYIYRQLYNLKAKYARVQKTSKKRKKKRTNQRLKNIKDDCEVILRQLKQDHSTFVETTAAKTLRKSILTENVVIVTGCTGSGKTFTVHNVLLSLQKDGYEVIIVNSFSDMVQLFHRNRRQVFYFDNIFGNHSVTCKDVHMFQENVERLKVMFDNESTKSIFTCQFRIYQDLKFKDLILRRFEVINLSGDLKLTLKEKLSMGKNYLKDAELQMLDTEHIGSMHNFPLLCSLYSNHKHPTTLFFEKTKKCFEKELDEILKQENIKYACIAFCVLFNNKVPMNLFKKTKDKNLMQKRVSVFEHLRVSVETSKQTIQLQFESMVGSFFRRTQSGYESLHYFLFDIFCSHVSHKMIECVINYGDSKLISQRALLESLEYDDESKINIPIEYEEMLFERIWTDYTNCKVSDVFESFQMQFQSYRVKFVSFLRKNNQNLDIADTNGYSAVYLCAEYGYSELLEIFCDAGGNVNQSTKTGITPLIAASTSGNIDCVNILLQNSVDINQCDNNKCTPLLAACRQGSTEIVEILCKERADTNMSMQNEASPLLLSSLQGFDEIVQILCTYGANVNKSMTDGTTPLFVASFCGFSKIVDILCEKQADVNQANSLEMTPLFVALDNRHLASADVILKKSANVNKCNNYGESPLLLASSDGLIDFVQRLCQGGADVNKCNKDGWSPLLSASAKGHKNCVEVLLQHGADVNCCDNDGDSPLWIASSNGFAAIVKILCDKRANINHCNRLGWSPLLIALYNGKESCANILLTYNSDINKCNLNGDSPLLQAANQGFTNIVQILCERGADVNKRNGLGWTPESMASANGHKACVEILKKI